jgi:hypothetical protein
MGLMVLMELLVLLELLRGSPLVLIIPIVPRISIILLGGVRGTIGLNSEDRRRPLACRMLRVCGQGAPIEAAVGDIKIVIRNALYIVENIGFIDVNKTGWRSRARKCLFLCFSSQNGRKNRPFRPLDGKYLAITASGVPSFLRLLEAI